MNLQDAIKARDAAKAEYATSPGDATFAKVEAAERAYRRAVLDVSISEEAEAAAAAEREEAAEYAAQAKREAAERALAITEASLAVAYDELVANYLEIGGTLAALEGAVAARNVAAAAAGVDAIEPPRVRATVLARLMATDVPRELGGLLNRDTTTAGEVAAVARLVGRPDLPHHADLANLLTTPAEDAARILDGSLEREIQEQHRRKAAADAAARKTFDEKMRLKGEADAAARRRHANGEAVQS